MHPIPYRSLIIRIAAGAVSLFASAVIAVAAVDLPYSVEFSPSGVLKNISYADGSVAIQRLGDFVLQGQIKEADGKVTHTHVAGPYGQDYIADTEQVKTPQGVTYKLKARHPRFNLAVSYVCDATSIKVTVDYSPLDVKIDGGYVQMLFPVKFAPDFCTGEPQFRNDNVRFNTARGPMTLVFDNINWARYGVNGLRGFSGDSKVINFYFGARDLERPESVQLKFEIQLPGLK